MSKIEIKSANKVKQEKKASLSSTVRNNRDRFLTETDWVVVKHNELGTPIPQEWLDYRQALRDIPEQTGFPEEIDWPQEPES